MYNLYTYEKKILENQKRKNEDLEERAYRKKRKKELKKLSENYENRIKDFIYTMCEKPVICYRNSESNKNKTTSNEIFKLGEYKSTRQRLDIIEENEKKLKKYDEERKKTEKQRNILKIKTQRNLILIQPKMKFKSKLKADNEIDRNRMNDDNNAKSLNSSNLEKNKKLKNNGVKKIKEFYNLIDKDCLKDNEIINIIDEMNDIEQWELNNQYNIKKYLDWKFNKKIIYDNDSKSKKDKNKKDKNEILKNIGINNNKIKTKKDFKTHFKGLSQFIELMESNEEKDNKLKRNNFLNKKTISSLNLRNNILKYMNNQSYKKSRNLKSNEMKKIPRQRSSINLNRNYAKNNILLNKINKKESNLNDIYFDYRKKELLMLKSMNKEINKSISKDFMKKYNSIAYFDNSSNIYIPEDINLKNLKKSPKKIKKENFQKKFELLTDEIAREQKQIHNKKYKIFVKKFAKSIFGFNKKEIRNEIDQIKTSNPFNNVAVDGKIYQKNDIKTLGNLILRKSNFYNKKNIK